MTYRLGVDIGGTFTDATLINETNGEVHIEKVPSTPNDPSIGFMEATQRILSASNVSPSEVTYVVHGTTVATNAIIEGKVARAAFITTEGFRDMLEIARQIRPSLYDLQFEKPKPLIPRHLCFGVSERLDAKGEVLTPLDEATVVHVAEQLRQESVESVAVCLLHAYTNPAHEIRVGEIIRTVLPDALISLSSDVAPEFREYYRASTTVINAVIRPVVSRYLAQIENRLREMGIVAELLLMQSSGGVYTFSEARRKPVFMVESGPAAGVISAASLGSALGYNNIISFDMGGTTAKTGLVQNGTPQVTKEYEVGATAHAGAGSNRGAGYPIRTSVIDLVEIGAGGGSIAWVDSGGVLRVGPQSAGADPGPVCYGKGGTAPTVTDANLVLGRLSPDHFLGGKMTLNVDAARDAIQRFCADPLQLDVVEAANGIVEIANAAMVNALRLVSVQRGYDPRDFVLVAFGGAGPAHANRLAAETEIPTTVIPLSPGTFSALGLLVTDLKHDYSTTHIKRVTQLNFPAIEQSYETLINAARATLEQEGVAPKDMSFLRQVDMRFVGQSYELTVTLPDHQIDKIEIEAIVNRFYSEHDRAYGFSARGEPVEFVNLRLTAIGKIVKPQLREIASQSKDVALTQIAYRPVYFTECGGFIECPIYDRYQLAYEHVLIGPAIVVELDSTLVIQPGYQAVVDKFGNLVITKQVSSSESE